MTRRRWVAAGAVALVAVAAIVAASSGPSDPAAASDATPRTERVERGPLSALVSGAGTLTYRARPDGSPFVVIGRAPGVFTQLPSAGDVVRCGGTLYRVDNRPVLLLCGALPMYRALRPGERGADVRALNRTLHVAGDRFTPRTERALRVLQRRRGLGPSGVLTPRDAVVAPEAVRVAKVSGVLGAPSRPGAPVLTATSDVLHVRVDLDAAQQGDVRRGDRVAITLPGNTQVAGRVAAFGRVARAEEGAQAAAATIPTFIALATPGRARGLDQAPVQVDITTRGVRDALSVPVTALVGRAGGGFAVEVVRAGGRRDLVAVRLGLFDTGGGRVQVDGPLRPGDAVAVPSL